MTWLCKCLFHKTVRYTFFFFLRRNAPKTIQFRKFYFKVSFFTLNKTISLKDSFSNLASHWLDCFLIKGSEIKLFLVFLPPCWKKYSKTHQSCFFIFSITGKVLLERYYLNRSKSFSEYRIYSYKLKNWSRKEIWWENFD